MPSERRGGMWLSLVLLPALALSCTSARRLDTSGSTAPEEACFEVRRVDSFSPLHDRFIYVRVLGGSSYLLTLDRVFFGLPYATGIRISSSFGRVCSDSGAVVSFQEAGVAVSSRILRVEAVASKEAAEKLVEERTTPRPRG